MSSVFPYLLVTERYPVRAAPRGGFSTPVMSERAVSPEAQPLLVTNARGGFTPTVRSSTGFARFGLSVVPLEFEPDFFPKLFDALWQLSEKAKWGNRFSSVQGAVDFMKTSKFQPKNLVIPTSLVGSFSSTSDGIHVGDFDGVRVLSSKLPRGSALISTNPSDFGVYTRVGDHLGIQLFNVQQTVALVKDGLVK